MRSPEIPYGKEKGPDLSIRVAGFHNSGLLSNREVVGLLKASPQLLVGEPPLSRILFRLPSEMERKLNWKGKVSEDRRVICVFHLPDIDTEGMRERLWDGPIERRLIFGPGLEGETKESFELDFEKAKKELSQGLARIDLKWTTFHELVERWLNLNFSREGEEDLKKKINSLLFHEDIFIRGFWGFEEPKEGRDTPKEEFCDSLAMFFGTPRLLKFINPRRYQLVRDILNEYSSTRGEGTLRLRSG